MGSLQIVVSLIVAPQTSLMVSYVFISLFSKQTPHFDRALSLLSGKGHMPDVVAFHVIQWLHSAGRGGGSAKSVWTLTVMTQFKNNLYSWALIFEFHITFLCQEIFFRFWFFFSPVMKICSDHQKLQLGKTCRFGPRAVIGAYPNSCWNPTHCCVSSGIVALLACACFPWMSGDHEPFLSRQSPPCIIGACWMASKWMV